MNSPQQIPDEELLERQQFLFALTMFCTGLVLGSSALRVIIDIESVLYDVLSVLRAAGGIAVLLLALFMIWHTVRLWRRPVCVPFLGFVQHANLKAMSISWSLTLLTLALMTEFIDYGRDLPAIFFTKMATAVLLLSFSVSFFILIRVPNDEDDD